MFEQQKYREALAAFAEVYNQSQDENEREIIWGILDEAFYAPNKEELRANYERNLRALKQYPYFWGDEFPEYEQLAFQLFPMSDEFFYCYSKEKDRFTGEYDAATDGQMRYFFENTDELIKVENEDNLYNLNFLNDNVRASEDYAADNHIYLFYDTAEPLERLMMTCDLEPLLRQKKFVFLTGRENFSKYPVDFKTEFNIDYSQNVRKEIGLDDIKRIIFGWKTMNVAGTSFLAEIMDFHPDLITVPDCLLQMGFPVFFRNQFIGKSTNEAISFLRGLSDDDERKSWVMLLLRGKKDIGVEDIPTDNFFDALTDVLDGKPNPSPREWITAIYLAYSRCRGREFDGRTAPALFIYPHDDIFYLAGVARDQLDMYFDIVGDFPYHKIVTCVRDPITHAGSTIRFMTKTHKNAVDNNGKIQLDPFYCFAFGCFLPKDIFFIKQHPLFPYMRVVRFEDLKLNPEAAIGSLTEFLNIPHSPSLYKTTTCGVSNKGWSTSGELFEGFDPKPIFNEHSEYLSIFDKYRIEMALEQEYKAYGYKPMYYDGQEFTDNEKMKLMELPYHCETIETVVPPENLRAGREQGMEFIRFRLALKQFPLKISGIEGDIVTIPWLRPKEELLRVPLYANRVEADAARSDDQGRRSKEETS